MKNILRLSCLSIFFCLAVNLHGQTFSFQCICDNVTGDTCDVCQTNSLVTSRLFCGILVYKNGTPFKWIDEPYTIRRLKNESLQFIELIPNPESITIGRWQTQFATMQGYVDSTTCQCSSGIDSLYAGFGIDISGDTISVDTSLIATLYDLSLISTTTNLSFTGSSSPVTLNSSSGTDVTFTAGTGISIAATSSNATITNTAPDQTVSLSGSGITIGGTYPSFTLTAVDGSTTNELQTLSVAANTTTLSSGGGSMTIAGAGINTVGTAGSTITITGTEVDGSVTNEAQTLSASGTTAPTINLTSAGGSGGGTITLNGAGITTLGQSGGTITITSTEVDGSTTNELQTLSVAANTTTLSSAGGSMTIAGGGINTVGTAGSTITVTGTEVDGSLSNEGSLTVGAGTSTTSIINSNTSGSTGVTIAAGTGMTISEVGNIITLANSGLTGTGTSGYLPKFTGSTTVDNSNVFQLSSAIGIGTTTPDTALTIQINTTGESSPYRSAINLFDINGSSWGGASTGITFSSPYNFSITPVKRAGIHMRTDPGTGNAELRFNLFTGSVYADPLRLLNTGQIVLPSYTGASSFTGTRVNFLSTTSAGNLITVDPTGMIGPTELASTAVTPGSYTLMNGTVDSDGRLTSASTGMSIAPTTGSLAYWAGATSLGSATVSNGVTSSSGTLKWGGGLTAATTLNSGAYTVSWPGNYGGSNGFNHYYTMTASGTSPVSVYDNGIFFFTLTGTPNYTSAFHSLFRGTSSQSGTMPNLYAFQFEITGTGTYTNKAQIFNGSIYDGITTNSAVTASFDNYGSATKASCTDLVLSSWNPTNSPKFTFLDFNTSLGTTQATGYWTIYNNVNSTFGMYLGAGKVGLNNTTLTAQMNIKGAGATSGTYSLMVTNSSGTTSTAALAIRDDGKIGMGTNTPLATLHNVGDLLTIGILQSRGTGSAVSTTAGAGLRLYNTTGGTGQSWNFESSNTGDLDLYNGGSTLVFKNENDTYGFAAGPNATSTLYGENTHAAGKFSSEGDAQASELIWRGSFTGTAGGELYLDGASLRAILPTNSVWTGRIDMTAVCTALGNGTGTLATGQVYSISTNYVLKNIGGTVSAVPVVANATASFTDTGMGSADVSAVANNTDKTWKVTFQAPSNAGSTSTFKVLAVARLHKISY